MTPLSAEEVALRLGDVTHARSVRDFPRGHAEVRTAGLYAWWVDEAGAADLSAVLGAPIAGLIYAGQAGASGSFTLERSRALAFSSRRSISRTVSR